MSAVAAIDCGTNSTRLLVLADDGRPLCRELRITRLGEGVQHSRHLRKQAIERTIDALSEYKRLAEGFGVGRLRIFATSAARDASNRDEFFDAAQAATGTRPDLLTGLEEAELTYFGAVAGLPDGNYLVLDIGGGSTEFALGTGSALQAKSVDIGCVRLTEEVLRSDPYTPEELANAFDLAETWCTEISGALDVGSTSPNLVGVAGTVTSLAAMDLGLDSYVPERTHHHRLSRQSVEELFRSLSLATEAERLQDPLLPPGRSDVLTAGTVILLAVMRHFSFDQCTVSETDILDAAASRLLPVDR